MAPVSTGPGSRRTDARTLRAKSHGATDVRTTMRHVGPPLGQRVDDGDLAHGVPEAVAGHVEDDGRHQYSPGHDAPADLCR